MSAYCITIAEMCVTEELPPLSIVYKIMQYHIKPMNQVSKILGFRVYCLDDKGIRSGYRPYRWEISRARNGESEHTFGQGKKGVIDLNKKGASTWRCDDFYSNKYKLLEAIINHTKFTRIVIHNHHIYCDYKIKTKKKYVYNSTDKNEWTLIKKI